MVKIFELTGGMHYVIMLLAAATASKSVDDDDDGQCLCMQYSPINPYAFINNHILQSSMQGGNIYKPRLEETQTEMEEDMKTDESSSSIPDNLFERYPDDL